jgi:hypothetical protein
MCCVDGLWGSFGQLNLNVQAQSVCSRSSFSCVVNFRLEQVITPSLVRFRSSRPPRAYDDYYFYVLDERKERVWFWVFSWFPSFLVLFACVGLLVLRVV